MVVCLLSNASAGAYFFPIFFEFSASFGRANAVEGLWMKLPVEISRLFKSFYDNRRSQRGFYLNHKVSRDQSIGGDARTRSHTLTADCRQAAAAAVAIGYSGGNATDNTVVTMMPPPPRGPVEIFNFFHDDEEDEDEDSLACDDYMRVPDRGDSPPLQVTIPPLPGPHVVLS